jgi:HEAT repeat protein
MDAFMIGKAVVAYGPESMTSLAPLLKDKRREVVAWAIALHGMYRRNDQALAVLSNCVKDPDVLNRRSAVYGLAILFHPQAEPILVRYLDDADVEVRYHAAWGLANMDGQIPATYGKAISTRERAASETGVGFDNCGR